MAGRTKVSVAGLLAAAAVLRIDILILVGDLRLALVSTAGGPNGGHWDQPSYSFVSGHVFRASLNASNLFEKFKSILNYELNEQISILKNL